MRKLIYISVISLLAFSSCKKDDEPVSEARVLTDTPEIEFVSMSSSSIQEFDDVTLVISYVDGNGDLGTSDADAKSIFVTDNRTSITHEYHLQPLTPDNSDIAIQGELNIHVENIVILDQNNNSESTTFSIKIKDRAGNESNAVSSSTLSISK